MIKSKKELKKELKDIKFFYLINNSKNKREYLANIILKEEVYMLYKYSCYLKKSEYYCNCNKKIRYYIYRFKKNKLGHKLGIEIWENCFDDGMRIWHSGIIVNDKAKIGKNCFLHGNNCIGNNGITDKAPTIGDNVDIGYGAIIIGDVKIANNIKIGAGAVVVKDCLKEGSTLVGVPAHIKR